MPHAGNAIRAHQDLQAGEDAAAADGADKLANIYFSYQVCVHAAFLLGAIEREGGGRGGGGGGGAAATDVLVAAAADGADKLASIYFSYQAHAP